MTAQLFKMALLEKIGLLLFFLLFLFCATLSAAPSPNPLNVRLGVYENKPKVFTDNSGSVVGIFPDLFNIIADREDWQVDYVPGTWIECLERLEKAEIDVMVDVAYSKVREEKFDFSRETVFINWATIYSQQGVDIESLFDLQGKKIAVMQGSIHTDAEGGIKNILKQFNIDCQFIEVENYQKVFALLDTKVVDAGVVNRLFGSLHEESYKVSQSLLIFNPRQLKFAFPKNSPKGRLLRERIDHNLKEMKDDPNSNYQKIIGSYLSGLSFKWKATGQGDGTPGEAAINSKIKLNQAEQAWLKRHPKIRFGVDPEFRPFEYIDKNGTYSGIASDYIKLLKKRLGLNLELVSGLSWAEVMQKVKKKEIDLLPCVGLTEERRQYLRFSKPYLEFQRVIITRTDSPFIAGLDSIGSMRIAVQENTSHEGFIREHTNVTPQLYRTLQEAVLAVANNKADAFIGNIASTTYWIRKSNLSNLKVAAPASDKLMNLFFAVRKDWPELVGIINKGLATISTEEKNEIHQRWVSVEYTKGINPAVFWRYVMRIILGCLLVFFLFFIWNYKLKKEILHRKKVEDKLQHSRNFEHFISEMSSRFIGLKASGIDHKIEKSLGRLASFTNSDAAYVFAFDREDGTISCTHLWHVSTLVMDKNVWRDLRAVSQPVKIKQLLKGEVSQLPSLTNYLGKDCLERTLFKEHGIRAVIHVPQSCQDEIIGFIGLVSTKDHRVWTEDEISLFTFISQIFTNALVRKKSEELRQAHSEELERSQKVMTSLLEDVNNAKVDLEEANRRLKGQKSELEDKNEKLKKFNRLFVERELRIKELKDKVLELRRS